MGYPRLKYPSGSTSQTTIDFRRGPIDFICEAAPRSHASVAASGFRAVVNEATDLLVKFTMPAVRMDDDYQAWCDFAMWAGAGGAFDFWPDSNSDDTFHCVSDDLVFVPARKALGCYEIQFAWRVVPDSARPLNSGRVMQWYYGRGLPTGSLGDGGQLIFPGYPITYMTDWEDQAGLGDHSYGNGTLQVAFDVTGKAQLSYLGTRVGTASTHNNFGWNNTVYVGMTAGAGPAQIPHVFAVGEEIIVELHTLFMGLDNIWYSGPASRNSDNQVHEFASIV